jgi:GDP-D-mannose dehydratase
LIGVRAMPEVDPHLSRTSDLPHLVGDGARLTRLTGWRPSITFDQTLQDVVNAQTD